MKAAVTLFVASLFSLWSFAAQGQDLAPLAPLTPTKESVPPKPTPRPKPKAPAKAEKKDEALLPPPPPLIPETTQVKGGEKKVEPKSETSAQTPSQPKEAGKKDSPTLAIVVMHRMATVSKDSANELANSVASVVQTAGIPVTLTSSVASKRLKEQFGIEAEDCVSNMECIRKAGLKLEVQVIVGIEVGLAGKNAAIHIGAMSVSDGKVLTAYETTAQAKDLTKPPGLDVFGKNLVVALAIYQKPEETKVAEATKPPEAQTPQAKPKEEPKAIEVKATAPAVSKPPAKKKIAVLDVKSVGTFDPKTVQGLTTFVAFEVEKAGYKVLTGSEITAILGFDRQRQLLGCTDSSCLAEIGGSLGADYLLDTEVSEVGGTWLLTSTLISASKSQAIKRVTKRVEKVSILIDNAQETTAEALSVIAPVPAIATVAMIDSPRIMRGVGIGVGVAGVLTAGVGAIFGAMAKSDYDNAKAANSVNRADFSTFKQGASDKSRNADICFAIGGAVAATGIVLIVVDAVRHSEPAKSVTLVATGNGIGVTGTW